MAEGIYLRIQHVGPAPRSAILLNDILMGEGGMKEAGRGGFPRHGAIYVPTTGSVDLVFTSSVALSYESGCIRGFVTTGLISATFIVGTAFADAVFAQRGWGNYNDAATTLLPAPVLANVWTTIPCDTLGAQTTEAFLPPWITTFYDLPGQKVDLSGTRIGDLVEVRVDTTVVPTVNNARMDIRLWFPAFGGFALTQSLPRLDSGAGTPYYEVSTFLFYIGSDDVRTNGAIPQIRCGSDAALTVQGFLVTVR